MLILSLFSEYLSEMRYRVSVSNNITTIYVPEKSKPLKFIPYYVHRKADFSV